MIEQQPWYDAHEEAQVRERVELEAKRSAELEALKEQADRRAEVSGIPQYVLQNNQEMWLCGERARNDLWPTVEVIYATEVK